MDISHIRQTAFIMQLTRKKNNFKKKEKKEPRPDLDKCRGKVENLTRFITKNKIKARKAQLVEQNNSVREVVEVCGTETVVELDCTEVW